MNKLKNKIPLFLKEKVKVFKNLVKKIKKNYNNNFHSKWFSKPIYISIIVIILFGTLMLNIYYMEGGKYSLSKSFFVLNNWSLDKNGFDSIKGISFDDWQNIQRGWYNIFATILAGVGMTLAAVATQSLTRNPIAEGSTLGLLQGGIFGVIFATSYGLTSIVEKYLFTIILCGVGSLLLLIFIFFSKKHQNVTQKIILAGLAIGVIFKTLSFLWKSNNANLKALSFAYVLGGAESISSNPIALSHDKIIETLVISAILISISFIVAIINIKGMNLLEIGEERAKNLGSSVILTRILNIVVVLLSLPAAIIVVGNMAFLGLFSVHAARWIMKSRNYKKVLPFSLIIGVMIASIGLQLTEHIPQINSGIWMTFIGAPYLIYMGIRGLK